MNSGPSPARIFSQRIAKKTGLSLAAEEPAAEWICVLGWGYECRVVTAVSEGISGVPQPGRFLPRKVTVSRLEL